MQDPQSVQSVFSFLQPRYKVEQFETWEQLEVASMQQHPCIFMHDIEPQTYESRNLLQLFLVHNVRLVHFQSDVATAQITPTQIVINKQGALSDTLKALMRMVLGYTGSFEYNAMEFLKENLIDVYCELLRRQLNVSVVNDPPTNIITQDDSASSQKELSNTVRFDVVADGLRVSFALRGPFDDMKLLIERAMKRADGATDNTDVVRSWNNAMEGVSDQLKRVLNMYGIRWEASEVTTRMYIDRLHDDYHWYITRPVTLDHRHGFVVIFGVSLNAHESAVPAQH